MADRSTLSKRQLECLRGVANHLDSHQIAHELGISPHTVDGHISSAMAALGARSRRDAARMLGELSGQSLTGQFPPLGGSASDSEPDAVPRSVREEASDRSHLSPPAASFETKDEQHGPVNAVRTLALIVGFAAAVVILLLAIEPLTQGAARLANMIQPAHR